MNLFQPETERYWAILRMSAGGLYYVRFVLYDSPPITQVPVRAGRWELIDNSRAFPVRYITCDRIDNAIIETVVAGKMPLWVFADVLDESGRDFGDLPNIFRQPYEVKHE